MADDFSDKEIAELAAEDTPEFVEDLTEQEAMDEVNKARSRIDLKKRQGEVFAEMKAAEGNPIKLWHLAYDWLMESNADARADVKAIIEECRHLRDTRATKFARTEDIGLRWGMRLPEIVLNTLGLIDPRIHEMEALSPEDARGLYRELEREFPQFRIPKLD